MWGFWGLFFCLSPLPTPQKKAFFVQILLGRWVGDHPPTRGGVGQIWLQVKKESRKVWESSWHILSTCERTHCLNMAISKIILIIIIIMWQLCAIVFTPQTQPHRYVSSHWLVYYYYLLFIF